MYFLRQSTSVTVQMGPFLDKTTGVDLEVGLGTALDNATTGLRLTKNGAALVDRNDATVPAYTAMGLYTVVLDATDTGTLGTLKMIFEEAATCLPVWMDFMVMPANVWDSLFGADLLDVNVTQWLGTAVITPTLAGLPKVDIDRVNGAAEDIATKTQQGTAQADLNTITGVDGVTLATAQALYAPSKAGDAMALTAAAVDDIWDEPMVGHGTADTSGLVMNEWQDGGRLDAILDARMAEASITTAGGAVSTVTTTTTATNLTNAPTNGDLTATMKASVNTEVDNALNVTTYAEPVKGTPLATTTLVDKIGYLYKVLRNKKTSTASLINIYNDDTTTIDHQRAISDDATTYTEGEIADGPP